MQLPIGILLYAELNWFRKCYFYVECLESSFSLYRPDSNYSLKKIIEILVIFSYLYKI